MSQKPKGNNNTLHTKKTRVRCIEYLTCPPTGLNHDACNLVGHPVEVIVCYSDSRAVDSMRPARQIARIAHRIAATGEYRLLFHWVQFTL